MNRRAVLALVLFSAGLPIAAQAQSPEHGGIVFTGSSIFRFWTHLYPDQMAPLPVLNRADRGHAVTQDMLNHIRDTGFAVPAAHRRLLLRQQQTSARVRTQALIIDRTKRFIQVLHEKSPNTFFLLTRLIRKMLPEKRARWKVVEAVNGEMERYSREAANVGYIDLNPVLFAGRGNVRMNLFLPDGLHFRPDSTAYPEFSQIVKPILTKAWESGTSLPVTKAGNSPR